MIAKVCESKLKKRFDVTCFDTGEGVVEKVSAGGVDLVILDLKMPVKDGFETLKELKTNSRTKSVPVLVLTVYDDSKKKEVMDLGANLYLTKTDYEFDEVMRQIDKMLS